MAGIALLVWGIKKLISEATTKEASPKLSQGQLDERKKDIWYAIKEWVESPIRIGYGVDRGAEDFMLATEPPKLAAEIEACLKNHYPTIWNTWQEFRAKCGDASGLFYSERKSKSKTRCEGLPD